MSKLRGLHGALAVGMFAVGAGSGTAALVPLGRPQLPIPSADWALVAAVTGAALIGLFGIQTALIALIARRPLRDAVRATTGSFSPLLLLWPLLLGVTFSDTANHLFVYHPGMGLWWGGVAFGFAVAQVALLPVQLDGGVSWRAGPGDWRAGLRRLIRHDPHPLLVIVIAYTLLRLTVRFAFETARFVDPKRPFDPFYNLATLTDQGVYPYLHRWSEYPPGFPWLSAGVYRAVSFFGVTYERYYAGALALRRWVAGAGVQADGASLGPEAGRPCKLGVRGTGGSDARLDVAVHDLPSLLSPVGGVFRGHRTPAHGDVGSNCRESL